VIFCRNLCEECESVCVCELEIDPQSGESTFIQSLKEKLPEKSSPCTHLCAQSPPLDAHPLNESIKQLESRFSSMSHEVESITRNDTSKNLVLYGLPETEQNELELSNAVLDVTAVNLRALLQKGKFTSTRIGNTKPPPTNRPRPVRIRFQDTNDRQKIWKARTKLKGTQFALNEDLSYRERIQRSILKGLAQLSTLPSAHLPPAPTLEPRGSNVYDRDKM